MDNISIKVLNDLDPDITFELKKLEISNLGQSASINEWVIPVFIKYGKVIVAVKCEKKYLKKKEEIIAVNELLRKWGDPKTVFIHSFYVKESFRGKGIGSLLLEESIKILKKEKVKNIELTVDPQNMQAIRLYEKFNFKKADYIANLYGKGIHRDLMICKI
ncbi:MAG: GNAT family N-acetyltransferase [Actinomycetota bacterium]|nr:GNAT family N-acetyltransferase [Actinomycetota bacterium]